jgi:hypothetical protein
VRIRWLVLSALAVLLLQLTWPAQNSIYWVVPNFFLIYIILMSIYTDTVRLLWVAFAGGLVLDLLAGQGQFGLNMAFFIFVALLLKLVWQLDYGRAYSEDAGALSDFNGIYSMPYRFKDMRTPLAFGFYGEGSAPGAHIVDMSAGFGADAPMDRWTKGIIKWPVRMGGAVTIRHQGGDENSDRVGKPSLGLGLTGGLLMPLDKKHQMGFAIRHLFAGKADPFGPSANIGITRHHREFLDMFAEHSDERSKPS